MNKNKTSIKFANEMYDFLNNIRLNRIRTDQPEPSSYNESLEIIAKFFKNNNDIYLKMLQTEMEEQI